MEFKRSVLGAVLIGAAAFSGSAFAGATGNVGAFSEYMFRGISQGSGAAVQGGVDYASASGVYVGLWGSNIDWGPGSVETDFYAGYAGTAGGLSYDVGALYYYYAEEDETGTKPSANTLEGHIKVGYGPVSFTAYYAPKYFGGTKADGDSGDISQIYLNLAGSFPVTDSVSVNAAAGYTKLSDDYDYGTEVRDDYFDYSVGVGKAIDPTLSASFSVIGTDLKDDKPKFVLGLKKTFDL